GAPPVTAGATREPRGEAPVGTADVPRADAALERAVHELVNRHRRARGLAPLTLDQRISRQARLHSLAMAEGRTHFGHDGFTDRIEALGQVMTCRRTAENVASNRGPRDPAAEAG